MSLDKICSIFHKAKHNHSYLKVLLFPVLEHCCQDLQSPSDIPALTSYSYAGGWTLHPACTDTEMSGCPFSSLLLSQSLTTLRGFKLSESTADEHASKCGLLGCTNRSKTSADSNKNVNIPRKGVATACPGRWLPSFETRNDQHWWW